MKLRGVVFVALLAAAVGVTACELVVQVETNKIPLPAKADAATSTDAADGGSDAARMGSDADAVSGVDADADAVSGVDADADAVSGADADADTVSGVDADADAVSGADADVDVRVADAPAATADATT